MYLPDLTPLLVAVPIVTFVIGLIAAAVLMWIFFNMFVEYSKTYNNEFVRTIETVIEMMEKRT